MKAVSTTLLAIIGFYVGCATFIAVVVMIRGGTLVTALKVGFLIPLKMLGWI